jgi:hypothetical protein
MPVFLFENPDNPKEVVEVHMPINGHREHIVNGVRWKRVWTVPQMSIDSKWDCHNEKDFTEKTGRKKGTIGDIWQKSAELSEKRAQKLGVDPVKENYLKEYRKKTKGKLHPTEIKENQEKPFEIDFSKKKI